MTGSVFLRGIVAGVFCVAAPSAARAAGGEAEFPGGVFGRVFAPVTVAVPPAAAVRDLCVTADGEIRHYGTKVVDGVRRRVYIASRDGGRSWTTHFAAPGAPGALVRSPWSGEWIGFGTVPKSPVREALLYRSAKGPGDTQAQRTPTGWHAHELRQILPMKSRRRWIAAFSDTRCHAGECYHAAVALSDDDGRTWRRISVPRVPDAARVHPGGKRPHWFNDGCEPTVMERRDGTLVLALRTSGEHHAFCTSSDGGETWTTPRPDPAFWAANTMPYFFRLSDGRLLFIWNNTAMLPTRDLSEYPELKASEKLGASETVFTNRDALHAAISDDDGKTWRGFREIALAEPRNAADFRALGNLRMQEKDKSVHQTQALEMADGTVLLAYGQNSVTRRLVLFHPDWLLETAREEDFRTGLGGVSNHLYLKSLSGNWRGWSGHCAWNRMPGAVMARDPDTDAGKGSVREVLQLCRVRDPRLVSDRQGVVWNFPAARKGKVSLECRVSGSGFRFTLADHWMNPCDEVGPLRSPFTRPVTAGDLPQDAWCTFTAAWDCDAGTVVLSVDGRAFASGKLAFSPRFGLSYLHLQTLAEETDARGTYFRRFSKE